MKSIGEITALITTLGTVLTAIGGIGLKLVATWITGVRGLIREETKDLTSQNKELQEGHKKINSRLDRIEGAIQKVETRATALESKLELIRTDIKVALKENTNVIREIRKSQVEQISPNLSLIKGKKEE